MSTNQIIKLNLGCGPDIKPGYINIDTCPFNRSVIVQDIRHLNFPEKSVDEIYAKDIIEHLSLQDVKKSISNWSHICKPGGILFIQTICIDLMIEAYLSKVWDIETLNYMLYAGKNWVDNISKNEDFHKSCYSKAFLEKLLMENHFKILDVSFDQIDESLKHNPYSHNLNIFIKSQKIDVSFI
jgi:2-polyprenyl-3-methyl-5-hydroxy-6-metoxy-1,4-benzoquinol methylase